MGTPGWESHGPTGCTQARLGMAPGHSPALAWAKLGGFCYPAPNKSSGRLLAPWHRRVHQAARCITWPSRLAPGAPRCGVREGLCRWGWLLPLLPSPTTSALCLGSD